ncbi:hypothetical protein BH23THE1_BH23THE1_14780 [soil metagenome]
MRTIQNKLLFMFAIFSFAALMMLDVSVAIEDVNSAITDAETKITNQIEPDPCLNKIKLSFGMPLAMADPGSDPEHCELDCGSNPITCYATFDNCQWNCSTFYRCNPSGDCYSASGKNERDPSSC